jgi:hypothetical protein
MLNGAEEWQTGFFMGQPDADALAPSQAFADAVRDAWQVFWNTGLNSISSSYTFNQVKCARLMPDGHYNAGDDVVVSFPATADAGPQAGAPLPPQVACVATLIAGSGKGLAGKGRMYLPGVSDAVSSSGTFNTAVAQSIATTLATFFNTINASIDAPGQAINASKGSKAALYLNMRNVPINGVRVGNVYDTQRRRRNGLSEVYSTAVVAD